MHIPMLIGAGCALEHLGAIRRVTHGGLWVHALGQNFETVLDMMGNAELMTFARQGSAGGGREQAHSAKCAFQSGTRACQEPGASGSKKERRRK